MPERTARTLTPLANERARAEQAYEGPLRALFALEMARINPHDNQGRATDREVITRAADTAEALVGNLNRLELELATNTSEAQS